MRHVAVGLPKPAQGQDVIDGFEQVLLAEWLAQEIVGAAPHCPDRGVDLDIPTDDDDLSFDAVMVDEVHDMVAIHVFQAEIEQDQVVPRAGQGCQRFGAGACRVDVEMSLAEQLVQRGEHARLVVHEQQLDRLVGGGDRQIWRRK